MTYITANVSAMFSHREPWDVSNSRANLGDQAGRLTWFCATEIAQEHARAQWLISPLPEAAEGMREWASETGAWDRDEIAAWSDEECLALFAQNIAGELRLLGSDDQDLEACVATYETTDWDKEPEYPIGYYYMENGQVMAQYYTGI